MSDGARSPPTSHQLALSGQAPQCLQCRTSSCSPPPLRQGCRMALTPRCQSWPWVTGEGRKNTPTGPTPRSRMLWGWPRSPQLTHQGLGCSWATPSTGGASAATTSRSRITPYATAAPTTGGTTGSCGGTTGTRTAPRGGVVQTVCLLRRLLNTGLAARMRAITASRTRSRRFGTRPA
jgi:hypothetical protein